MFNIGISLRRPCPQPLPMQPAEPHPPLPRRAIVSPDVLCQHVEGQAVLLDMQSERYHSLDDVGTAVWDGLYVDPDVERLVTTLLGVYEVDEPTLRADVAVLLAALSDASLVALES